MVVACTSLLRGAGYASFDGPVPSRLNTRRSRRRTPMSRRRCAGWWTATGWRSARPCARGSRCRTGRCTGSLTCRTSWTESSRRAHAYENAILNLVEAETLEARVGEHFKGVITELDHDDQRKGTVMIREPAVEATVSSQSPLPVGEDVTVTLAEADPGTRKVRFTLIPL